VDRDIWLLIIGIALSGFLSWLFTHIYYRRSLDQQEKSSTQQIQVLRDLLIAQAANAAAERDRVNAELLRQGRIEESIAEYRRAGTPVRTIDTYADLTNGQKADLLDTVLLRVKGRPAKSNKYRAG